MPVIRSFLIPAILLLIATSLPAQEIPHLKSDGKTIRLYVEGQPFIMVSGELHNSSSSSLTYMEPIWPRLKGMGLNSVIASISWEQFEPEEGKFDYTLIDGLIADAFANKLKLGIIWFASWKNGVSSYLPLWVKKDSKRFFKLKDKNGSTSETVSPFCREARKSDAKAFAKLMKRIKSVDKNHTVIIVQPENEVGAFQDMDYNTEALDLFKSEVPDALTKYLSKNEDHLSPEMQAVWTANGRKTKGTWTELFGDTMKSAQNFMMSWQYATYVNEVVRMGKKEYDLPMYVNAWLVQKPTDLPGVYPNGGPVSRAIDIYKAAAPDIDICAPDIYLPNFREILGIYHRHDNPIFIPESTVDPARAFYAFGEHDAIGFSPFGIEDVWMNNQYIMAMNVINELMPLILQNQGTGRMHGFMQTKNIKTDTLSFGETNIVIEYINRESNGYGLVIQTGPEEFLAAGMDVRLKFISVNPTARINIGQVFEGKFVDGKWITYRMLNGDETMHNERLVMTGRQSELKTEKVNGPGIYKVFTYDMK